MISRDECSARRQAVRSANHQRAALAPTDYGVDPVQGRLVFADATRVVLARSDERAGTVHVHFPRLGFKVSAQG